MIDNKLQKTAYINALIIDPSQGFNQNGYIIIEGKYIVESSMGMFPKEYEDSEINIIDCKGAVLSPGFVDIKANLREPGEEHKENFSSASYSASSSGITSLVCMPNTIPIIDQVPIVEYIQRKARKNSDVKIYPAAAITKNLEGNDLTEIGLLSESGVVAFTDATKSVNNSDVMARALKYSSIYNALLMQHPEEFRLAKGGSMNAGLISTKLGVKGIPIEAEIIQIERDIRLVEMTGGRLHFFNITCKKSIDIINDAQNRGLDITCSTAPQYFTLTEESVGDWKTYAKVSPPLRTEFNREAIEDAISNNIISCIASDHSPHDTDTKRLPFEQAASGIIGFETLLPLTLDLVAKKKISLYQLVELLSTNPSSLMDLKAGSLKPGYPADIVVFEPNKKNVITVKKIKSKSKNTPFENYNTRGKVIYTIIDGKLIYNGK